MLLLSIFFLLLTIPSCKTITYRLPADEELPYLDATNLKETVIDLLFQHYYWKLRANDSRYIIGEITLKERDKRKKAILEEIQNMTHNDN